MDRGEWGFAIQEPKAPTIATMSLRRAVLTLSLQVAFGQSRPVTVVAILESTAISIRQMIKSRPS
jgi:hypothetical protein